MTSTEYLVWGIVAHIVADWMLQNDWMAEEKVRFGSLASITHALFHFWCLGAVFPPLVSLVLALFHMWVDTRTPLDRYRKVVGQATEGNPVAVHVKIWQDQAVHILCIAVAALIVGSGV